MDYNNFIMNTYDAQCSISYNMFSSPNYFLQNEKNPVTETRNRFVYVNQNFINANAGMNTKVLINPNFKQTVHINPNFKKPSIHVNPNILKLNNSVIKQDFQKPSKEEVNKLDFTNMKPIISTRTKLVRVTNTEKPHNLVKFERRKSINTKYKIIHSNSNQKEESKLCKNYFKNKYKIDKNISKLKLIRKSVVKSRYSIQNVSGNKLSIPTNHSQACNSKYISINGTLFKKTPNVLKKADLLKITSGKANVNKSKVLIIRGQLYKLDHHQRRLKMLSVTMNTSQKLSLRRDGPNLVAKKLSTSLKWNKSKRKIILSSTKTGPKQILINTMQKCNLSCPIYRRFGKCKANDMGRCIRVHNPDQVMLCTKFLQGACLNSNCLLSHKVSAEKMPTCKYFLEGCCVKENCVYLHVKISPKADICKNFLEGYCVKAIECDKRHQFLCPDYEKNGSCPRKRCQYPHGNVVRNIKNIKVAKRIIKRKKADVPVKSKTTKSGDNEEQCEKNVRYYVDHSEDVLKNDVNITEHVLDNELVENNCDTKCGNLKLSKRTQLGVLPSYIPLGVGNLSSREINL